MFFGFWCVFFDIVDSVLAESEYVAPFGNIRKHSSQIVNTSTC